MSVGKAPREQEPRTTERTHDMLKNSVYDLALWIYSLTTEFESDYVGYLNVPSEEWPEEVDKAFDDDFYMHEILSRELALMSR
jgi:hypothetical protein